jgi:putative ABC transport system substrate-binding protein
VDRRRFLLTSLAGALAAPFAAGAQPAGKGWRIGFLSSQAASASQPYVEALRQGLRELGYVEGRNIAIEYRWAEGNYQRLPDLAKELVGLNVDLIFAIGGIPSARAAKAATKTIPIVFFARDPVAAGIVSSIARPGGNLTGLDVFTADLDAKRLEILKEALPEVTRVAVLWNPADPTGVPQRKQVEVAAETLAARGESHQKSLARSDGMTVQCGPWRWANARANRRRCGCRPPSCRSRRAIRSTPS